MCVDNGIRYTHYNPPFYTPQKCCNCCCARCCTRMSALMQNPAQNERKIEERPPVAPALQGWDAASEGVYNDSGHETDGISNEAIQFELLNLAGNQGATQEDNEINVQNDSMPSEKGQTVNQHVDTAAKHHDQAGDSGLLCYRKWWERIEADISVNGKLITGVPIFVEENTLRVINNNYSYFIPAEKIDYIRTTDGLRSCFHSSDEKQTGIKKMKRVRKLQKTWRKYPKDLKLSAL